MSKVCNSLQLYSKDPANWCHLFVPLILAVLGGLSLRNDAPGLAFHVAWLSDVFMGGLLFLVALRSDGFVRVSKLLPHRLIGLFLIAFLFLALVTSFASMDLKSEGICPPGKTDCKYSNVSLDSLKSPTDGLYFSVVTMMTLGYGDYVAVTAPARRLVIWQLLSGWLLLILGFPLIVSRLAAW
jgi:hypothetical protein